VLFLTAWMQQSRGITIEHTAAILSGFFLLGLLILKFAPETRGQDLPD